jgi:sialic acid synthase
MLINKRIVGPESPCYLIAELSHNHQGSESDVMLLIEAAAAAGASAVKFQKRNNATLFLPELYNKPYPGKDSFGTTYGAHREFLEPKISWLKKANRLAHKLGLDFIMTVFDKESLALCEEQLKVDAYKIQSADLTSHFLIEKVAGAGKPYFISCGAASLKEIKAAYNICTALHTPFCMMYAVSQYPTADCNVNLSRITQLKKLLKTDLLGFSCHHESIEPAVMSRVLGTVAIEKHFTLDKRQKGPDHKLSITPDELREMRDRLDRLDVLIGKNWETNTVVESYQTDARIKMGKCAVAARDMSKGHVLQQADLCYKSPMIGCSPEQAQKMIGSRLKRSIIKGQVIPG